VVSLKSMKRENCKKTIFLAILQKFEN